MLDQILILKYNIILWQIDNGSKAITACLNKITLLNFRFEFPFMQHKNLQNHYAVYNDCTESGFYIISHKTELTHNTF